MREPANGQAKKTLFVCVQVISQVKRVNIARCVRSPRVQNVNLKLISKKNILFYVDWKN